MTFRYFSPRTVSGPESPSHTRLDRLGAVRLQPIAPGERRVDRRRALAVRLMADGAALEEKLLARSGAPRDRAKQNGARPEGSREGGKRHRSR